MTPITNDFAVFEIFFLALPWVAVYFAINIVIVILMSIFGEYDGSEKMKYVFFGLPLVLIIGCFGIFILWIWMIGTTVGRAR